MAEIGHGDIIKYSYVWHREHLRGEVSGRKARPACVMLIVVGTGRKQRALLFPITSQPPGSDTVALAVPETEARRAKLYQPAWVILDEHNQDDLEKSFALEDARPVGQFSKAFMLKLAMQVRAVMRGRRMKIVPRR